MYTKKTLPFNGIINCVSEPIELVEPGMHFHFDGKTLIVASDEPLSASQSMEFFFWNYGVKSTKTDTIIEGSIRPSGERAAFHVTGRPGFRDRGVRLGVVAYWIICDDLEPKDVGKLRFSGPGIDSFCPMTNMQIKDGGDFSSITVTNCMENVVNLGLAAIGNKELKLSAEAYWTCDYCRQINFESCLSCKVDSPGYGLLKDVYMNVASALKFCLNRGNVDLDVRLCRITPDGWETVGEFAALPGKMRVPDEHDEPHVTFVRAQNVGEYFGNIVSAFADGTLERETLAESRSDTRVITSSKIIELTSSFERAFRMQFPKGIEHRARTQKNYELARKAMLETAENLPSDSKKIVVRLSKRVEEDNLAARIRHTCKALPEAVADAAFENTGANRRYTQLGKKITTVRNDIAHGNKMQYKLSDIREEYRLLCNLVFAMRLMLVSIPSEDVARLLKCMG
jgi:hypothetical protein